MTRTIMKTVLPGICLILLSFQSGASGTRMLTQPALSNDHIAFVYADDLWVANPDGSEPRRLTIDRGVETSPHFSPDGTVIAFSAEYDGNLDVFVVPVTGGVPKRLTWHPGSDVVRGFTPDGKRVLFSSARTVFTNRYQQLFTVSVDGGQIDQLEIPNAFFASYSPDGKGMAYTPLSDAFRQWKNYRGGTVSKIWVYSFGDKSIVEISKPEGSSNDTDPVWLGNKVYFISDRNGEFNLFAYDVRNRQIEQLTFFKDFPIVSIDGHGNSIALEQAGYLHTYNTISRTLKQIPVSIATDLLEVRERYVDGEKYVRSYHISPSGARAVFALRGEIYTVPAEKGDARNITNTTGAHEKYPAWSPDGKSIAYFSDESGEYALHIAAQEGRGDVKKFKLNGTGFYAYPNWSPDSKRIAFVDNGRNLYLLDAASGKISKVATDALYTVGAFRDLFGSWSHDSKWIAYTTVAESYFKTISLYSVDENRSYAITDGLSDVSEPVFDPSGKYLYFMASTDAGPVLNWFDQSSADMRMTNSIYLATLQKETVSPFAKESDEEKGSQETKEPEKKKDEPLKIDFENIQNRIVDIPVKAGIYGRLGVAKEGELLYVEYPDNFGTPAKLRKYELKNRKDSEVMELRDYVLSADGKKMLFNNGRTYGITNAGQKPEPGKGTLNLSEVKIKIDPRAEWQQIYDEAWRLNRDYFYDPNMHGADWPAMKKKYAQFLPHLTTRTDLNNVLMWMSSELGVGHHRVGGGDRLYSSGRMPGGLLGADYSIANNRYRFKKIYGGLNWNPQLRSPLTEPGVNATVGDYLLAVNGVDLKADQNLYSLFENTAGKIVELTIGPNADYKDSRVVKVVPVSSESMLRNRDWVEGNLKRVTEATNGQVAYVYVPNTAGAGHEYFKRYFFPQAKRKAIIIDERFNGGGLIADYYTDVLQRPLQSYWNMRYGADLKTPSASIQGPKVMIIDETAGSGGDMLPWMFRKFNIGKLIGKRTWGGLVGTLGFPELMDGGMITAPNLAIWTKDGFIVENVGVAPDIEVEQLPSEILKGRDPQLEKAIEVIMEELRRNPQPEPVRPPYPIRVRK